jgi:hypothetical protein
MDRARGQLMTLAALETVLLKGDRQALRVLSHEIASQSLSMIVMRDTGGTFMAGTPRSYRHAV